MSESQELKDLVTYILHKIELNPFYQGSPTAPNSLYSYQFKIVEKPDDFGVHSDCSYAELKLVMKYFQVETWQELIGKTFKAEYNDAWRGLKKLLKEKGIIPDNKAASDKLAVSDGEYHREELVITDLLVEDKYYSIMHDYQSYPAVVIAQDGHVKLSSYELFPVFAAITEFVKFYSKETEQGICIYIYYKNKGGEDIHFPLGQIFYKEGDQEKEKVEQKVSKWLEEVNQFATK